MSVSSVITSGPLILAIPIAAAAGAVTFLSPCCLPLVPGYLSYVTGMSGSEAEQSGDAGSARRIGRGRTVAGTALFALGFSVLFASYGAGFGALGSVLRAHQDVVTRVLGVATILLGLLFAGVFERFTFTGRVVKPSFRPRAGLAGAPLLGVMFGLGWSPCIGPTLSAVFGMEFSSVGAGRGAFLAFVYGLGLGLPFVFVALAVQQGVKILGFGRRHARLITAIGGGMLVLLGVLEVSGAWTAALNWLQVHVPSGVAPL